MPIADLLTEHLGENYLVERELQGGGMSRVFVALERGLARRVAIKILSPTVAAVLSAERFRREIMVVAGLQHPNIIPVLSAGTVDGLPYFVMPFVEGESLRARLRTGPLRVPEAVGVLRDVARALAFAHARGVVHRDVKPDNVLLSSGVATVADFGVAKAVSSSVHRAEGEAAGDSSLTVAGTSLGTPEYMAPEQIAADPDSDHRSDIYSFGAMAYELLAGQPPFAGRTPQALFAAHLTEKPVPLLELRPGVPRALCDLVMQCLEKDRELRPRSADEVVTVLEDPAVVSGGFMAPDRPATSRPLWRRPVLLAAAVLALIVALAGVTWRAANAPATPALAVLPMVYVGADPAQGYMADGLTSDLTSALGQVGGLRVASRTSATAMQLSLARGERPGSQVTMFLEGVIQREGDRLRFDLRLVNATDGFMLWGDSFEGSATDPLGLQSVVRGEVVRAVQRAVVVDSAAAGRG